MSFMVKFCIVNQKGHIHDDVILHFTTNFFFIGILLPFHYQFLIEVCGLGYDTTLYPRRTETSAKLLG